MEIGSNKVTIGNDGCKGGWIAAIIKNGILEVSKYTELEEMVNNLYFDGYLIDMIIGLH
jgi:8-oxo-dGTP diphosphatase